MTLGGLAPGLAEAKTPVAGIKAITLSECVRMTPVAMAEKSAMIKRGYDYLLKSCNLISDPTYRSVALESLKNPTPKIMALFPSNSEKEAVKKELVAAGYLKPETTYDQFLPPCAGPLKKRPALQRDAGKRMEKPSRLPRRPGDSRRGIPQERAGTF